MLIIGRVFALLSLVLQSWNTNGQIASSIDLPNSGNSVTGLPGETVIDGLTESSMLKSDSPKRVEDVEPDKIFGDAGHNRDSYNNSGIPTETHIPFVRSQHHHVTPPPPSIMNVPSSSAPPPPIDNTNNGSDAGTDTTGSTTTPPLSDPTTTPPLSDPTTKLSDAEYHPPPEGFKITAHVISTPNGLSHFSPSPPSSIPFFECGSVGLTTEAIPLRHLNFRHLPPSSASPGWSVTESHPQLIVCLHPLQITVSGDVDNPRVFDAGDVILMENGVGSGAGHKISAIEAGENDLSVLILTLPYKKYHYGVLSTLKNKGKKPCPYSGHTTLGMQGQKLGKEMYVARRALLAGVGVGVSSFLTYFLGKVAPHVLAVGVGGLCVIAGGTCAVVAGGETLMDGVGLWMEKRLAMNGNGADMEDE